MSPKRPLIPPRQPGKRSRPQRKSASIPQPAIPATPSRNASRASAIRRPARSTFDIFAQAAPGLEQIVGAELATLGFGKTLIETGGVAFNGTLADIYRANLWLRTASRVVVRVAQFEARAFHELERLSRKVPWEEFVPEKSTVKFRVTCRKSRLYHSDGVADRIGAAVERSIPGVRVQSGANDMDEADDFGAQLFTVRLFHDRCTISADSSGALLHRRGYRQASGKAPLRETLGAAMVLGSGWLPPQSLLDPMCGSGTIPIEAAMIARRVAPGIAREFAFRDWPAFDAGAWESLRENALAGQAVSAGAPIRGSDRDAGVVALARENAARAGVANDVEFDCATISSVAPPTDAGWLISNPPYGIRVGDSTALRDLYAQLGNVLRSRFRGWHLGLLSADRKLESQLKLPLAPVFETGNGGIPVRFVVADV